MLWEDADPPVVLAERFGFDSAGAAANWVAGALSSRYSLAPDACDRIILSDGNALAWVTCDGEPFIAKWSVVPDRFARLAATARLTTWLGDRGHPVSAPVAALDGRTQLELDGISLSVQRVAPGQHLDVGDPQLVREAGATLARLHADLAAYHDAADFPRPRTPALSSKESIEAWAAGDLQHLPADAVRLLVRMLANVSDAQPPAHLVHGDYRSANILTRDGEITAVLDFEELRFDSPVGELARSAVMLGTLFHGWEPVSPAVHRAFKDGYEDVRALSEDESRWWPLLTLWWSLLMVPAGDDPTGWGAATDEMARRLTRDTEC